MAKHCAPHIKNNSITCYSKDSLIKISKSLDLKYKGKTKNMLWKNIKSKLQTKCNNEICWSNNNSNIQNKTFVSKAPKSWKYNKNQWLSTTDINSVLEKYEKKYKTFKYIGAIPSDCPKDIYCELSNFNSKIKNYKKIGIVYNLDKHYQSGSHWVAIFINLNTNKIIYFDSYGDNPPKLINFFIKKCCKNLNLDFSYNTKRYQYGDSECGMFSIYFILNCLKNKSLKHLNKKNFNDFVMGELRTILFR